MDGLEQPDTGQPDARVHPVIPCAEQWLYFIGDSINRKVPAWGSLSWYFDILNILVSLNKYLPPISIIDLLS
jgi:hypothetical protein